MHVYNNYYRNNELYGIASTMNGGVLVEGNYFENVPHPCYSAGGYADSGPGRLVQRGNQFVGSGTCETSGSVTEPPDLLLGRSPVGTVPAGLEAPSRVWSCAMTS